MATMDSDSMGKRLDNALAEIDALKGELTKIDTGEMHVPRISSHGHKLRLINITKKQHNLIVLLDDRIASLEQSQ